MNSRVTFVINAPHELPKKVGELLEKFRGFAEAIEEFIKSHTIINRDDQEHRSWVVNMSPTDNSSVTCILSRQNDSETLVSFGFFITPEDEMPNVQKVVKYLYPEFT